MPSPGNPTSEFLTEIRNLCPIECGRDAAKHFSFAEGYTNLNHGSYGTCPTEVRSVYRRFQDRIDARPDVFVRYEYRTHLLDESRHSLAWYLDVPSENVVLVQNATTAFDTVIRNLSFAQNDVIICFNDVYDSFLATAQFLSETTPVEIEKIQYIHPVSDKYICDAFEETINKLKKNGKIPKLAIFDTISSLPGVRMPFERLTELCRANQILSFIDAAHCIGQFSVDLQKLDADFFTSNCHKWLHVPRPCAVLYVPPRNQALLRATLPTGFGFIPLAGSGSVSSDRSAFVNNFLNVGTLEDSPYLCIQAALEWRSKLTWGSKKGEEAVKSYTLDLAQKGGKLVSEILQTEVLDNEDGTLSNCSMVNVRLPLSEAILGDGGPTQREQLCKRIMQTMIVEYQTAVFIFVCSGSIWARLSAQVYLTLEDFERVGRLLNQICQEVERGDAVQV